MSLSLDLQSQIKDFLQSKVSALDPFRRSIIQQLVKRSENLTPAAQTKIEVKILEHLQKARQNSEAIRERTISLIEDVEKRGHDATRLRTQLEHGQVINARRGAVRTLNMTTSAGQGQAELRKYLVYMASTFGITIRSSETQHTALLGQRLLRLRKSIYKMQHDLNFSHINRAQSAGKYHAHNAASDLLSTLQTVSPTYLQAMVSRFEMLGQLKAFVDHGNSSNQKPEKKKRKKK